MSISYAPLFATLHRKKIGKTELQKKIGASPATFSKIAKDEYIALRVVDDICNALDCEIIDVMEHVKDNDTEEKQIE